ncbi:MAG: hypothetical protein US76_00100 [Parcubacteria group bacterium GW2011_GWA2_38_13b]|nr:MAG: hypothetical protein US76_00100 [Parcubacteria group bacterium GW2011_GWA2_38_13b]
MKNELNIKLSTHEFTRNSNDSVCHTLIYKPINIEESKLGDLFIVGEIDQSSLSTAENTNREELEKFAAENTNIISQISSQIKREYYKDRKRDSRKSFEESIKKANSFFAEIVSEKKYFNIRNVNFIVAAYANQLFHFTACGKSKIFLLRGDSVLEIEKKLFIEKKIYAPKIFNNIATGRLAKKDFLILATSRFPELFPPAAIKTVIANNSFENSCEYISETLRKDKKQAPCGLIMIRVIAGENVSTIRYSYEELKNAANIYDPNRVDIINAAGNTTGKQNSGNANNYKSKILFLKNNGNEFLKQRLPKISCRAKKELFNFWGFIKYFFGKFLPACPPVNKTCRRVWLLKNAIIKYSRNGTIRRKKTTIIAALIIFLIAIIIFYFLTGKSTIIIK